MNTCIDAVNKAGGTMNRINFHEVIRGGVITHGALQGSALPRTVFSVSNPQVFYDSTVSVDYKSFCGPNTVWDDYTNQCKVDTNQCKVEEENNKCIIS